MSEKLKKLIKDEEGPTAVEYALMVAGIAVAIIGAVFLLGNATRDTFNNVGSQINERNNP